MSDPISFQQAIHDDVLIFDGAMGTELYRHHVFTNRCFDELCLSDPKLTFPAVQQNSIKDDYHIYFSTDIGPTVSAIIAHIEANHDELIDLRVERPSLEERFLEITDK